MNKALLLQATETLLQGDILSAEEYTKLIIKIKTSDERVEVCHICKNKSLHIVDGKTRCKYSWCGYIKQT